MERFWSKVDKTESCWLWTGATSSTGYGQFWLEGKQVGAHRFAYEQLAGQVPKGLQLDHLCRVRRCVNPSHLEPVTVGENIRRGETGDSARLRFTKTHCSKGHPLVEGNLYHTKSGNRQCRTCAKDRAQARRDASKS